MKLATIAAIAAISLATPAMAQEACPASHDDYRHPTPVWGGFGNQVNACPGDKIEVAAKLVVNPNNSFGILQIPQTSAWYIDLGGLSSSQLDNLRDSCQSDLPCVSRFKIRVIEILHTCQAEVLNPWMAKNNNKCILVSQAEKERWQTNEQVIAVLDGWRANDGWEYGENPNYNPPPPKYACAADHKFDVPAQRSRRLMRTKARAPSPTPTRSSVFGLPMSTIYYSGAHQVPPFGPAEMRRFLERLAAITNKATSVCRADD